MIYGISKWGCWVGLKLLFGFRAQGAENIPKHGGVLLVANHASFMDPVILGVGARRKVHFMARDTLAKVPLLGWWMRSVGVVLVDRNAPSAKTMSTVIEHLQAGEAVGVFPEGTRTRTGELGEFKRGVLLLLKKTRVTVVPAAVRGSFHALPRGRILPRLFRRCSIAYGAPMTAEEVLSKGGLEALRERVAELGGQTLAAGHGKTTSSSDGSHLARV